jgi:long-chain acyl-CoA synthetase
MRLSQCISRAVQVNGDGIATIFGDRVRTWAQLAERTARLAAGMRRLGVQAGDRVAFLGLNSDRYLEYFMAVPWAGAVFVPLNTRLAVPEMVEWLEDSGSRLLFVDDAFVEVLPALRDAVASLEYLVHAGDGPLPPRCIPYEALIEHSAPMPAVEGMGTDLAGLFYTGGTTGRSKGVMLSHQNLLASAFHLSPTLGWGPSTNYLHAAPMFHLADGAGTFAMAVAAGMNTVIDGFSPEGVMRAVQDHRVTAMTLVPTMINMLVSHPGIDRYDLSSLRSLLYGGSPIPEAVIARTLDVLPDVRLIQGYGQTEAAPVLTLLGPERHVMDGPLAGKTRSAGQAVIGCEVSIRDEDGRELPVGSVGEICGRGDNVMLGYWRRPELSAQTLRDGWLHTGDGGYMDQEGYVFVVDRVKDMIVTGGENVYSIEVENAIHRHPAVAECAVIGIPSSEWGEQVHAIVRLREGARLGVRELIDHCRQLIAGYKCPRSVDIREEPLPTSGAGKILKSELRKPYWMTAARAVN